MDTAYLLLGIKDGLKVDPVVAKLVDECQSEEPPKLFSLSNSRLLLKEGRIYIPDYSIGKSSLQLQVMQDHHDHMTARHPGQSKTIELIHHSYNWPSLQSDVKAFISSCTTCNQTKVPRHKPYGLLQPLLVPKQPWTDISMDVIKGLPLSKEFDCVLTVVDRFSKQAIFIPCDKHLDSPELAWLFITHIFSKHGVPAHASLDQGSEFMSEFSKSLGKLLDMQLHFTSGWHPSVNGQAEQLNQTLEQYLRIYCNYQQLNWSDLLPLAEFAYNNALNATTRVSPFFANKGYNPLLAVHPEREALDRYARQYVMDLD